MHVLVYFYYAILYWFLIFIHLLFCIVQTLNAFIFLYVPAFFSMGSDVQCCRKES